MTLWRISRHRDLSGIGGLRANGRWHYAGRPVVYLSESPASALVEICVHTAANDVPPDFTLLRIVGPEVAMVSLDETGLPASWRTDLEPTRVHGTAWLRAGRESLLQVPSAVIPHTSNFLLNPLHPDAALFQITESMTYPFDRRLKQ